MDTIKIIRLAALAVAVIAAFVTIPYITLVMVVLGLAMGIMGVSEEQRIIFMITAVTLAAVAGSLDSIPVAGVHLTTILENLSTIINAGALAVILMIIKDGVTE